MPTQIRLEKCNLCFSLTLICRHVKDELNGLEIIEMLFNAVCFHTSSLKDKSQSVTFYTVLSLSSSPLGGRERILTMSYTSWQLVNHRLKTIPFH